MPSNITPRTRATTIVSAADYQSGEGVASAIVPGFSYAKEAVGGPFHRMRFLMSECRFVAQVEFRKMSEALLSRYLGGKQA